MQPSVIYQKMAERQRWRGRWEMGGKQRKTNGRTGFSGTWTTTTGRAPVGVHTLTHTQTAHTFQPYLWRCEWHCLGFVSLIYRRYNENQISSSAYANAVQNTHTHKPCSRESGPRSVCLHCVVSLWSTTVSSWLLCISMWVMMKRNRKTEWKTWSGFLNICQKCPGTSGFISGNVLMHGICWVDYTNMV